MCSVTWVVYSCLSFLFRVLGFRLSPSLRRVNLCLPDMYKDVRDVFLYPKCVPRPLFGACEAVYPLVDLSTSLSSLFVLACAGAHLFSACLICAFFVVICTPPCSPLLFCLMQELIVDPKRPIYSNGMPGGPLPSAQPEQQPQQQQQEPPEGNVSALFQLSVALFGEIHTGQNGAVSFFDACWCEPV